MACSIFSISYSIIFCKKFRVPGRNPRRKIYTWRLWWKFFFFFFFFFFFKI